MSQQLADVDTLFLHEQGGDYRVAALRDGERLFHGRLELKETDAGPRPARLRVIDGSSEDLHSPDRFVELARRATRIRISEQTSPGGRETLQSMLDAYQLEATAVRTCRLCAGEARYSPLTGETAIETDGEHVCPDCARAQLDQELAYRGEIGGAARDRLEDLLLEVQDLERITNLLSGDLDPELTKFDEISPTVEDVDPVRVDSLSLHPDALATFIEEEAIGPLRRGEMDLEAAIEEVLRYRSPVKVVTRQTAQPVEVQGRTIPEDEVVIGWLASANRDPRVFEDPDTFEPERDNLNHVAFGKGVHTCLGSSLARLEARVMLDEFLDRVADAELLTDNLDPFFSRATYGMERLPIRVEPA